jgi:hypothetical protein
VFPFVRVKDVTARRVPLAAPVLAWVLFALVLALAAVSMPLAAAARQLTATDVLNDVMLALLTAALAGAGLVVAWHPAGVVHQALEPAHMSVRLSERG